MHVLSYRSTKAEFGFHVVVESGAVPGSIVLSVGSKFPPKLGVARLFSRFRVDPPHLVTALGRQVWEDDSSLHLALGLSGCIQALLIRAHTARDNPGHPK
jgi:hypothetical protein